MLTGKNLRGFLRSRLAGRDTVRRVFDNSFWLSCDQMLRMAAGFVVGVWMARYLGPEGFGWLNYALATVGVVSSLASLGIGSVVVRELVRAPEDTAAWMGAAFFLRASGAAIGFLVCVLLASRQSAPAGSLTAIVAAGMLFQILDVVDLMVQAQGRARVAAGVRMTACVFASLFKATLILVEAPLEAFAAAGVAELAVTAGGWWWWSRRAGCGPGQWRAEGARVRALLRECWPLALSGFAVSTQAYADQLILGLLLGADELGQYAAALRLVSVFAFVPMVVQTAAAPEITRAKRDDEKLYWRRLHNLYRLMLGIFVATAIPLAVLGPEVVRMFYGASYAGAAALIPWLTFRLFLTNYGVARSVFVANEGLFRFALVTSLAGAAVNLGLNFLWVPMWGARGAIAASLISFAVTIFVCEAFEPRARKNLRLMLLAIALPWRRFAG